MVYNAYPYIGIDRRMCCTEDKTFDDDDVTSAALLILSNEIKYTNVRVLHGCEHANIRCVCCDVMLFEM